jgi:hypothetical protein
MGLVKVRKVAVIFFILIFVASFGFAQEEGNWFQRMLRRVGQTEETPEAEQAKEETQKPAVKTKEVLEAEVEETVEVERTGRTVVESGPGATMTKEELEEAEERAEELREEIEELNKRVKGLKSPVVPRAPKPPLKAPSIPRVPSKPQSIYAPSVRPYKVPAIPKTDFPEVNVPESPAPSDVAPPRTEVPSIPEIPEPEEEEEEEESAR